VVRHSSAQRRVVPWCEKHGHTHRPRDLSQAIVQSSSLGTLHLPLPPTPPSPLHRPGAIRTPWRGQRFWSLGSWGRWGGPGRSFPACSLSAIGARSTLRVVPPPTPSTSLPSATHPLSARAHTVEMAQWPTGFSRSGCLVLFYFVAALGFELRAHTCHAGLYDEPLHQPKPTGLSGNHPHLVLACGPVP
jgi:hypothetical protein